MPSATTRLRELARIADDAEALRDALREDAGCLGEALGVSAEQIDELAQRDDVVAHFRRLAVRARHQEALLRADVQARRALAAADRLVAGARWLDSGVELEPRVLLGDVLADTARPWLALRVDGSDVVISRARLRRAALALRAFQDVRALADSQALRLRWRGGRGGLNFSSQGGHVHDGTLVLRVVLDRPVTRPAQRARPSVPAHQSWLNDVFADVIG
ncbi:MAG: hypothetical protein U0263_01525 [Polyangiaceae bacterium]